MRNMVPANINVKDYRHNNFLHYCLSSDVVHVFGAGFSGAGPQSRCPPASMCCCSWHSRGNLPARALLPRRSAPWRCNSNCSNAPWAPHPPFRRWHPPSLLIRTCSGSRNDERFHCQEAERESHIMYVSAVLSVRCCLLLHLCWTSCQMQHYTISAPCLVFCMQVLRLRCACRARLLAAPVHILL